MSLIETLLKKVTSRAGRLRNGAGSAGSAKPIKKGADPAVLEQFDRSGSDRLYRRRYDRYDNYQEHQASKLAKLDMTAYHVAFRAVLAERLGALGLLKTGETVLCLAARVGTECLAFIDHGCFAVGVDLNPGKDNRYVVSGDFHELQFADASVDYVFTNSLDHAYDLPRVLGEVRRVLKPQGLFIAEIMKGAKDPGGRFPGPYESLWWDSLEDVAAEIGKAGFAPDRRFAFEKPWAGEQILFKKTS
jgi:SAM-dependent methyltransferase